MQRTEPPAFIPHESLHMLRVPLMRRRMLLVVEDDEDLRRLYRIALALEGFDVEEAANGFEALIRIDGSLPNLIVLDLMLPHLSGYAVLQEIAASAHTRRIPVVVVTGSPEPLDHHEVFCVLRKPITSDELITVVRRCLVHHSTSAP